MQIIDVHKKNLNTFGYSDFLQWRENESHIYIGRNMSFYVPGTFQSKWHNPYKSKKYALDEALKLYEKRIRETPELWNALPELEGKVLGCWCVNCSVSEISSETASETNKRDLNCSSSEIVSETNKREEKCHGQVLMRLVTEYKPNPINKERIQAQTK